MHRLILSAVALAAAPLGAFSAEPISGLPQDPVSGQDRPSASAARASEPRTSAAAGDYATRPRNPDGSITVTGEREAERRRAEENRIVCRREVRTGSMMPQTTCRPAHEWARLRERSIEDLERVRASRRENTNTNTTRDNIAE